MAALAAPAAVRGRRNWTIGDTNIRNWTIGEENIRNRQLGDKYKAKAISAELFELNLKVNLFNTVVFMTNLVISRTNFLEKKKRKSHTMHRYTKSLKLINLEKEKKNRE